MDWQEGEEGELRRRKAEEETEEKERGRREKVARKDEGH